jgi:hypothetical protein
MPEKVLKGGCLCGAVRYEATAEPLFEGFCHCRDCQRVSGTGHVPVIGVPKPAFSFSGKTTVYAVPGTAGGRHFCPVCGAQLFGMPGSAPDMVTIYIGSLDDPSVFAPTVAIFTRSRHAWDRNAMALTEFEALPPE